MQSVIEKIQDKYKKTHITDIRPGDTVKVHQKIREGNKERIQIFQGLVIRITRKQSHTSRVTVRRVSGGVGVEKSFLLHSPLVAKIEVVKRSKVRRNYLAICARELVNQRASAVLLLTEKRLTQNQSKKNQPKNLLQVLTTSRQI